MKTPVPPTEASVPIAQRNWTCCPLAEAGKFASTSMKPPEFPVQPERPESGLPLPLMIPL